jgi:two-component system cell cycle sensor histidine kinase/response regulator CckA
MTPRLAGLGRQLSQAAFPYVQRWVVAGSVLVTAGYSISIIQRFIAGQFTGIATEAGALVLGALGLTLALQGRTRLAGALVLGVVWAELHASLVIANPGLTAQSGFPVFPILVVATGLFFGGGAALTMAGVSAVTVPLAVAAAYVVFGVPITAMTFPTHPLTVLDATMIGAALLVRESLRAFDAVLRARVAEAHKYALLVQHAPYGIVLLSQAGRIEALNPAAASLLELPAVEVVGRRFAELLGPAALEAERLMAAPGEGARAQTELTIARAGGRRFVEASGSRTVLDDGTSGTLVMLRDVTEHRELERHLVQLGRMLDRAPYEVYVFNANTLKIRFTNVAARHALGYQGAELDNLTVGEVLPELTRADVRRVMTDLTGRPDEVVTVAGHHRRKDGTSYPVESRLHVVSLGDEPALGLFAVDVSARVAAEDAQERLRGRMLQAQRLEAVQQLAGGIAHVFNNLLMSMGGHAEMIAELASEERVREWAGRIRAAQERGAGLIRRLNGLARTDVVRPIPLALADALREFLPVLDRTLGPQVHVTLEASGHDVVLMDRAQLEQLVLHLATNARDAMPSGGAIRLVVRGPATLPGDGGDVELEVHDTGRGMSAETVQRAFDPFFSAKKREKSIGLGLTIVRSIVTQAGGQVELESVPEVGTTARVRLPASREPPRRSGAALAEADAEPAASESGGILVVEDDADNREVVAHALARAGYQVRAVPTAEDGLAWLAERQGDVELVLTDIALPGMTGFALGGEVAARFAPLRVLYMSGYAQEHIEGAPDGFDPATDLLVKPFSAEQLLAAVRFALRRPAPRILPPAATEG